jgi:hypothetical protein
MRDVQAEEAILKEDALKLAALHAAEASARRRFRIAFDLDEA